MFPFDPGALILCVIFLMQIAGFGGYYVARHKYKKREEEAAIRGSELQTMIDHAVRKALASAEPEPPGIEADASESRLLSGKGID